MVGTDEQKLTIAIHETEKLEQDLVKKIEWLKQRNKELNAPDAISQAIQSTGTMSSTLSAPHLAD